ncbi:MAG TPA: chorismate synthase [Planctomycetota bacterium]|nr:chorismate synthase [Planctomycetota bacterium]
MLTFLTAGESHGRCLIALIEGLPFGLELDTEFINAELARRQGGYGRGRRMKIETDRAEVLTGVRQGRTIGAPLTLMIQNRDFRIDMAPAVHQPRPGHADLPGMLKFGSDDARPILERASARETAARVAAGAVAKLLLSEFGIDVLGYVLAIGSVKIEPPAVGAAELRAARDASDVYCPDLQASQRMKDEIESARRDGDTLGGLIRVEATGVPPGLGSHAQWRDKLDGRIAQAVMSVQAIKSVEIGMGREAACARGSEVHDEIVPDSAGRPARPTNRAGGIEGGISNGCPIIVTAAMKPIPTLMKPLWTVDVRTGEAAQAVTERSDVCAVPAASVVVENAVAFVLAAALVEKLGGDSLEEMKARFRP